MKKHFSAFQKESAQVIASFAGAIASVAKAKRPNQEVITRALEASLANALASMAGSLASSINTVRDSSFATNVGKLRKQLKSQAKLLVRAGTMK